MARQTLPPTPEEREAMIREAAYFRYLEHGCSDGHDLEDWLAAEAEFEAAEKPAPPVLRLRLKPKGVVVKGSANKPVSQGKATTPPAATRR